MESNRHLVARKIAEKLNISKLTIEKHLQLDMSVNTISGTTQTSRSLPCLSDLPFANLF